MTDPEIKDDNLRLILSDQEIEFRDRRIDMIQRERVMYLGLSPLFLLAGVVLFVSEAHYGGLVGMFFLLSSALIGLIGLSKTFELKKYRERAAEHREFLAKYNRTDS